MAPPSLLNDVSVALLSLRVDALVPAGLISRKFEQGHHVGVPTMPKRTRLDWLLEALSLALLSAMLINLIVHWSELPDRVPHHYSLEGDPNIWGGKGYLLVTPFVAAGLYVLMTATSRYGGCINLPIAIDRKSPEIQQILLTMTQFMKAALVLAFAYISWAGINTAMGRAQGLGGAFLPILLAGLFGPLIYFTIRLGRYRT